jgi:hypothetical protein
MSLHEPTAVTPDWLPIDQRVADRRTLHLPVYLIAPGGERFSAAVVDVSTHGFRIRSGYPAKPGRFLAIDVPAFARYSGWVAWTHPTEFGFDAANPLPHDVVNHLVHLAVLD